MRSCVHIRIWVCTHPNDLQIKILKLACDSQFLVYFDMGSILLQARLYFMQQIYIVDKDSDFSVSNILYQREATSYVLKSKIHILIFSCNIGHLASHLELIKHDVTSYREAGFEQELACEVPRQPIAMSICECWLCFQQYMHAIWYMYKIYVDTYARSIAIVFTKVLWFTKCF